MMQYHLFVIFFGASVSAYINWSHKKLLVEQQAVEIQTFMVYEQFDFIVSIFGVVRLRRFIDVL